MEKKVRAVKRYHLQEATVTLQSGETQPLLEVQLEAYRPIPRFKGDLCRTEWLALTPDLVQSLIGHLTVYLARIAPDGIATNAQRH